MSCIWNRWRPAMCALLLVLLVSLGAPVRGDEAEPRIEERRIEITLERDIVIVEMFAAILNPSGLDFELRIPLVESSGLVDADLQTASRRIAGEWLSTPEATVAFDHCVVHGLVSGLIEIQASGEYLVRVSTVPARTDLGLRLVFRRELRAGPDGVARLDLPRIAPSSLAVKHPHFEVRVALPAGMSPDDVEVFGLETPLRVQPVGSRVVLVASDRPHLGLGFGGVGLGHETSSPSKLPGEGCLDGHEGTTKWALLLLP